MMPMEQASECNQTVLFFEKPHKDPNSSSEIGVCDAVPPIQFGREAGRQHAERDGLGR